MTDSRLPNPPDDGRLRSILRALVSIREGEGTKLFWASGFLFSVLAGNYLIRPVRDEMGITGGTSHLPALFAGTLAAVLLMGPLVAGTLRKASGLSWLLRGLQLCLIAFFVALISLRPAEYVWAARGFFVWASASNLLMLSLAWGTLAASFSSGQAQRLFGVVAAGGTLGAIVGSTLAEAVASRAGPAPLLLLAAGCLEMGLLALSKLLALSDRSEARGDQECSEEPLPKPHALRRYYLPGLGLWTLLFTLSSAIIYLEQARIVDASMSDPADRTAFFARIDLIVNALGLVLQVALTASAFTYLGAGGAAAILPIVTMIGAIVLVMRPTVSTVQWFQVIRRASDYAIARPSREVFYTVLTREEVARGKGFIDTAVYRAGDAIGAWTYGILAAIPAVSRLAPLAIVPLCLVWIVLSLVLGHAMKIHRGAATSET